MSLVARCLTSDYYYLWSLCKFERALLLSSVTSYLSLQQQVLLMEWFIFSAPPLSPSVTNVLFQTCWQRQHVMALILFMLEIRGGKIVLILAFCPSLSFSSHSLSRSRPTDLHVHVHRCSHALWNFLLLFEYKGKGGSLKLNGNHTTEACWQPHSLITKALLLQMELLAETGGNGSD